MVKAALKVGGLLEKAKSVNVFKNGIWQNEQMGYVYYQGEWIPFMEYYLKVYEYGTEFIEIGIGSQNPNGVTLQKLSDRINISNPYDTTATRYINIATEIPIDFTKFDKVFVEWDRAVIGSNHSSFLVISGSKTASNTIGYAAYTASVGSFDKKVDSVDVSELSGFFYIQVSFRRSNNDASSGNIYKIWVE